MPHTAGPWKAGTGVASTIISGPDGRIIGSATVNRTVCSYSESVANANLIAAAPLQNEALRMVMRYWKNKRATNEEYRLAFQAVAAAIAAAEGEETKS